MRLSKIKLAGFKSFVDPTTISFPSALTGVIGPNGCGKSNVIDAVRWVMGEISAKHLRGDSMADVIFSGSSNRKPVSSASVELIFDNSDGSVGGEYAGFNEISVRRQVTRDGTSAYYLNGTRCRRRDIQDIFLGTGLGPRSYAIIEQGMISDLIQAKPEELRVFLEEAAGISKYKERRRETENRIRNTRENLDRLSDLRDEVETQLQRLDRQARTAEKYKEFKQEERKLQAQLIALRIRELDSGLQGQDRRLAELENSMQSEISRQRSLEAELEKDRERQSEASEAFNEVQGRYYGTSAEITRTEQAIQHAREMRQRQEEDLERAEHNLAEVRRHIERDREQLEELKSGLAEMEPGLERMREQAEQSSEAEEQAAKAVEEWQQRWNRFSEAAGERQQSVEVQRTELEHMDGQLKRNAERLEKLQAERQEVATEKLDAEIRELEKEREEKSSSYQDVTKNLEGKRESLEQARRQERELNRDLHQKRSELENLGGRISSLDALQQAALGKDGGAAAKWLQAQGLADRPRLAERIQVTSGWERAVETVLGYQLDAVAVDELDSAVDRLADLHEGELGLVSAEAGESSGEGLAGKVTGPAAVMEMLKGVRLAETLQEAARLRGELGPGESVITPDGTWLARHWVRVRRGEEDEQAGVLAREQELKELTQQRDRLNEECEARGEELENARERLRRVEAELEEGQRDSNRLHRQIADLDGRLESRRSRREQAEQRAAKLDEECEELRRQIQEQEERIRNARAELEQGIASMESGEEERRALEKTRDELREKLDEARRQAREDRDAAHDLALKVESRRSTLDSTRRNLERMETQLKELSERRESLSQTLAEQGNPVAGYEEELEQLLSRRKEVDEELAAARRKMETIDADIREKEQKRAEHERQASELREQLEKIRLESQEARTRRQTLAEQLNELEQDLDGILEELGEEATAADCEEQLQAVQRRISRLGAINLAAIDEFREQSERKEYLDNQHEDLTEALATLESAIRKIDRETRTRFKETYDKVNTGLKETFPRLFGGGHAYLEMTGEDLLDAGVTVMARPPGKRNSSISALSGGEKALTAVSLVFAIFELNPAPFCMLDEVDAPLDDANVGRFCDLVQEMSERVQFILITHNKITMELSNQLMGVTMNEPGVSRLVSVDVNEAVELAAV